MFSLILRYEAVGKVKRWAEHLPETMEYMGLRKGDMQKAWDL
jgi:hypothetical protein